MTSDFSSSEGIDLEAIQKLVTTTLIDSEYQQALRWRDQWLNTDTVEGPETPPLSRQIVAYLVADAEQLRKVSDALAALIRLRGAQQEDTGEKK